MPSDIQSRDPWLRSCESNWELDVGNWQLHAYSSIPAIVAVRKLANVPASIARRPSRARSWRRSGASAPMPPIWMPIELKLAKPHSANVAIVNDFGSSVVLERPELRVGHELVEHHARAEQVADRRRVLPRHAEAHAIGANT